MTYYSAATSATLPHSLLRPSSSKRQQKLSFISTHQRRRPTAPIASLRIGVEDIVELANNKVLVAATLASAIGQLSKPLSAALNGKGIDLKAAIRSGGMPSTHSAGVAAAATSLGLERGFSDSIFGMSVVFAAFVMYDAQGVRREVGYHARILNRMLKIKGKSAPYEETDAPDDFKFGASSINSENVAPLQSRSRNTLYTLDSDSESFLSQESKVTSSSQGVLQSLAIDGEESSEKVYGHRHLLNESVGHTEIQVIVGALLGFVVSLIVDTIL